NGRADEPRRFGRRGPSGERAGLDGHHPARPGARPEPAEPVQRQPADPPGRPGRRPDPGGPGMSRAAVALCLFVSAGLAWPAGPAVRPGQPPGGPVLALPGENGPFRLRLDVVIDGKPPTAAWDAFLDRLFDFFDRDGDGWLSRDEVSRMVPLPLPGGKE